MFRENTGLSSLQFQYLIVLIPFCRLRNHWFTYCIILLCVRIAHYFKDLSYLKLSQNQIMCQVLFLRTLMFWRILTVYLLEQWPSSMQETVTSMEPPSTKKILKVKAFFIKCAKYLQTSFPVFKNNVIKSLTRIC